MPIKRFCPRRFNLLALIVGSVSPDFGYGFGPLGLDEFSHSIPGLVCFCLPVGLLVTWLVYRARPVLARLLPAASRREFKPLFEKPPPSLVVLGMSLLIGGATHLLWDALTHKDGWFVTHAAVLQVPLGFVLGHTVRIFHVLWYVSSFVGVGWLCLLFDRWRQTQANSLADASVGASLGRAFAVATLALLLAVVHHLVHHWLVLYLVGFAGMVGVVAAALALSGPARSTR